MNIAIITAAGSGKRIGYTKNKILMEISGKPIIYYTIKAFQSCEFIDRIIIVTRRKDIKKLEEIKQKYNFNKIAKIIEGGRERQDSVYNGLKSIDKANQNDIVVIHNGANPLVNNETIIKSIKSAIKYSAAIAAFPARDTIRQIDYNTMFVKKTLDRKALWQTQTPQAIKYWLAIKSFNHAYKNNFYGTDDVSLVERLGYPVKVIRSNPENIKITYPHDVSFFDAILKHIKKSR